LFYNGSEFSHSFQQQKPEIKISKVKQKYNLININFFLKIITLIIAKIMRIVHKQLVETGI